MHNKIKMIALAVALMLGGTTAIAADDPMAAKAQKMIEAAEMAQKKASSVDGEWRDTGKMIKGAKAALKTGDTDKAMKLARKAEVEGELGYKQAISQRELRIPSYMR